MEKTNFEMYCKRDENEIEMALNTLNKVYFNDLINS